jgi:hypothetical protein
MSIGTAVQLRLHEDELAGLDAYRRQHSHPPTRPAAARELIKRALSRETSPQGSNGTHAGSGTPHPSAEFR